MRRHFSVQLTIVAALMTLTACGGSPSAPSNTVDFTGVWQGSWQLTSCSETGGAQGSACNETQKQSPGSLRLTLTQAGTEVQGSVEVASFLIPASGNVNGSGALSLTGQAHSQIGATGTLSNWTSTRSGSSISGSFTLTIAADNPAFGSQTVRLTLQNVTKTS